MNEKIRQHLYMHIVRNHTGVRTKMRKHSRTLDSLLFSLEDTYLEQL